MRAYDEPMDDPRPLSALPSPLARALAFMSILLGGAAGGLIGFALVDIQYSGDSPIPTGVGLLTGSLIGGGGTAIVAVLVLRALGEWHGVSSQSNASR